MQLLQIIRCLTVTMSFVYHQKPRSLQSNQIYGNLVTNIPQSKGVIYFSPYRLEM
jgi:hypothetical protein